MQRRVPVALARRAAAQAPPLARTLLGSGWRCAVWTPHFVSRTTARGYGGGQPLVKLLFRPVAPQPGARSLGAGAGERGWRAYWNWTLPAYATRLRIMFRFARVIVLGYGNDSACGSHHMHTPTHARARSREPNDCAHRYARSYSKRECVLVHTLPHGHIERAHDDPSAPSSHPHPHRHFSDGEAYRLARVRLGPCRIHEGRNLRIARSRPWAGGDPGAPRKQQGASAREAYRESPALRGRDAA